MLGNEGSALKSLFGKTKGSQSGLQLGLYIGRERISVAIADHSQAVPRIIETHFQAIESSLQESLAKALKSVRSSAVRTVVGLGIDECHFHKIQKPNIPAEEMDDSVLFLIKDRLSQKIEDSLVACVDYPPNCRHDDQLMVFEVRKTLVQEQVDALLGVGLDIEAIDVAELLLGDLFATLEDMNKGIAIVVEQDMGVYLLLYRNHYLYLIRRLQDVPDLLSCLPAPGNVGMADTLMLEVQRTLDYYDSLMGQSAPRQLFLMPSIADLTPLAEHLDANLAPSVVSLDLNALFELPDALDYGQQHDLLTAVAASLRRSQS